MILLVDNYDSFTFNLAQLLRSLGAELRVERNDALSASALRALHPSHIVLSPGPYGPLRAGVSLALVEHTDVPLLGVCLGHQCIAHAFGARVTRATEPVHGKAHAITHNKNGLFTGLSQGFCAARYHSLAVDEATLPACLEVTARTEDRTVMALRHVARPLVGVQFHPESVLSPEGPRVVENFLKGLL